jgi:steroid 5-alpha reductase family enzyme
VNAAAFLARYRVRLGYPLAVAVLLLAHPNPRSILYGALVGIAGLLLRALAAGYLHKQKVLTVAGPYAYTRNPLYFGSALLACGAAIATHSWFSAALLAGYFGLFYSVVMRREEGELRLHHGPAFAEYARAVPLFFPRMTAAELSAESAETFSFTQYKKNHEWQAPLGYLFLLALLLLIWRLRMS